jgi:hypothetical protein
MDEVFPVKLSPSFEPLDRVLRRISRCHCQTKTFPIGLKLFVLAVTILQ